MRAKVGRTGHPEGVLIGGGGAHAFVELERAAVLLAPHTGGEVHVHHHGPGGVYGGDRVRVKVKVRVKVRVRV